MHSLQPQQNAQLRPRGHDENILEEAYRGRYARQRLLNFWPESSCGYHAIKRFVCIIQVEHGCFLLANYRCSNSLLLRVGVLVLVGYDPALETERVQVISEPEEEINICDVARFFNFQSAARLGRLLRPRSPLNSNAGEELRPERPS